MTRTGDSHQGPRRRLADIDAAGVAEALDDTSTDTRWWYDATTGRVELTVADELLVGLDERQQPEQGRVLIESPGSRSAYRDMVDFANAVGDSRKSELLMRALEGRGAFRRFRDSLDEFDDLRERWLEYRRAASELRAIDWLVDAQVVAGDDIDIERAARSSAMSDVLADVAAQHDYIVAEVELIERWDEISDLIDARVAITVTRNDRAWASITPVLETGQNSTPGTRRPD